MYGRGRSGHFREPGTAGTDGWFVNRGVIDQGVNGSFGWAPELSADGLELYFGSSRGDDGDLYVAIRERVGDSWGPTSLSPS